MLRTSIARNRSILFSTLCGFSRGVVERRAELRHHVIREGWTVAKRFAAGTVENIELREIPCTRSAIVEGYLDDPQRLVLAALARGLDCRTFFELGTNRGRTTWTVARNNPELALCTLDLPVEESADETAFELGRGDEPQVRDASCGEAFRGTPEAGRITQLWGDSATFDFSPYEQRIDLVYIDGAHTYDYVRSDTLNALRMLSASGTIVWDDYATAPGIYAYLTELAPSLDRPVYHVLGTRLAVYSRQDFVERLPFDDRSSRPAV